MPANPGFSWNVLVVDNNSSDSTRDVVLSRAGRFPVPLSYLFEGRQGKSNALNTGMSAAQARIIVFTDDDVDVGRDWIRGHGTAAAPAERTSTTRAVRSGRSGAARGPGGSTNAAISAAPSQ